MNIIMLVSHARPNYAKKARKGLCMVNGATSICPNGVRYVTKHAYITSQQASKTIIDKLEFSMKFV